MIGVPDPALSRAVLIGTSTYEFPGLNPLPTVAANLRDLAAALCSSDIWGLHPEHCEIVLNPSTAYEMIAPIARATEKAKETLLVYYAGHGLPTRHTGSLQLALTGTEPERDHTAVPFDYIRAQLLTARARHCIVVLDCCLAARAFGMNADDSAIALAGQADVRDPEGSTATYVLAAAAETRLAVAPPGETHTAFTGELLGILRDGISGAGTFLTPDAIFQELNVGLLAKGRPLPQCLSRNDGGKRGLVFNRAVGNTPVERTGATPGRREVEWRPTTAQRLAQRKLAIQGRVMDSHKEDIESIDFSPDGSVIATSSWDKTIRLWDVTHQVQLGKALKASDWVECVAFNFDGTLLAAAENDGVVRFWDIAKRGTKGKKLRDDNLISDLIRFSPDGTFLASAYARKVGLWNVAKRELTGARIKCDSRVESLFFHPDGTTLVLACAGAVEFWDLRKKRRLGKPFTCGDNGTLSPDGAIVAASRKKAIQLWNSADRSTLGNELTGHRKRADGMVFSPDGSVLASYNEDEVRLWDVARRSEISKPFKGSRPGADMVKFSPDGRMLAIALEESMWLWA
ncbi:caspase family protein [Streptosporangiaceae bacterium NEAU-GS5]|nr:caspase family protein [Streptosporangiaceae bacterium NEAU-GS5]